MHAIRCGGHKDEQTDGVPVFVELLLGGLMLVINY